jgi:hypothetical protein
LQDPQGRYDFTGPHISGEEIFAWIADLVDEVLMDLHGWIGFTFSFPMQALSIDSARLLSGQGIKTKWHCRQDPSLMLVMPEIKGN